MKTNLKGLKKLIEEMGDDDYLLDHDLNLTILNPIIRAWVKDELDLTNNDEVSRFLTMVICFSENGVIDDEILAWDTSEFRNYLANSEVTEEQDREYVQDFIRRL